MTTFSRLSCFPLVNLTPSTPVPAPLMDRFRRVTTTLVPLTLTPKVLPANSTPPATPPQSIVRDLVMVTAPNPPGSRQSISPPAAVLEIAPAKVLHGAVREQGFASFPTP